TEWGLTYEELNNKFSNEIRNELVNINSKNIISDYNLNSWINSDYQNIRNTYEKLSDTDNYIWSYKLITNGTPPLYPYRDLENGTSNSINFRPGESKTVSVFVKHSLINSSPARMIWYDYNEDDS